MSDTVVPGHKTRDALSVQGQVTGDARRWHESSLFLAPRGDRALDSQSGNTANVQSWAVLTDASTGTWQGNTKKQFH